MVKSSLPLTLVFGHFHFKMVLCFAMISSIDDTLTPALNLILLFLFYPSITFKTLGFQLLTQKVTLTSSVLITIKLYP